MAPYVGEQFATPTSESNSVQQLDKLANTLNDSLKQLVQKGVAGLSDDVAGLSERIDRHPLAGGGPASRKQAVDSALEEFAGILKGRVNALVREASAQITEYAATTAGMLKPAAEQKSDGADTAGRKNALQNTDPQTATFDSEHLKTAVQRLQSTASDLEAVGKETSGRAANIVRQLQKAVAQTADALVSRMSGEPKTVAAKPDAQPQNGPGASAQREAARQPENPATAAGRQIMAKVKDAAEVLQELGRRVSQLEDRLPKDASGRPAQPARARAAQPRRHDSRPGSMHQPRVA